MKAAKTILTPLVLTMNSLVFCLKIYIKSYYSIAIFIYGFTGTFVMAAKTILAPLLVFLKKEYINLIVLQYLITGTFMA